MSMAIAPFWFSMEYHWLLIAPFWLSTDDEVINSQRYSIENQKGAIGI